MRKAVLGILALTALGMTAAPVKADSANVQSSSQSVIQEGSFNTSRQRSRQDIRSIIKSRGRSGRGRSRSSSGNVQDIIQEALQSGRDNLNDQNSRQKIETRSEVEDRGRRRRREGRRRRSRRDDYGYGRRDRWDRY